MPLNKWYIPEVKKELEQAYFGKMEKVGAFLNGEIGRNIAGQGVPSLKAVDTSNYLNSRVTETKTEGRDIVTKVEAKNVDYAYFIEMGTSKMPARPSFRWATYSNKGKILNFLKK